MQAESIMAYSRGPNFSQSNTNELRRYLLFDQKVILLNKPQSVRSIEIAGGVSDEFFAINEVKKDL